LEGGIMLSVTEARSLTDVPDGGYPRQYVGPGRDWRN
jgi:hypothetical protein